MLALSYDKGEQRDPQEDEGRRLRSFGLSALADRRRNWARVDKNTNVLISHGPPYGILDNSPGHLEHHGDPELSTRCKELSDLRLICFGHIHTAYGLEERDGKLYVNAALMGARGELKHPPIIVKLSTVSR